MRSVESYRVNSNLEILADNPPALRVMLPDSEIIRLERKGFRATEGFVPRIGTNEPLKNPRALPSEREYRWYGYGDDSQARFTVHQGHVNGSISTPDRSFVVDGNFGQINLAELDLSALPSAHGDVLNEGLEQVNSIAAMSNPATARAVTGPVNIQVLAMYTPDARDDAGGQAALDALIQASMDSLNSATADSDIGSITFGLAGSQLLNGFSPGPTPEDARNALRALRLNNVVRTARDNTLADIVITFVKDVSAPGGAQLAACGNAFVQNQECSPGVTGATCGVGTAFEDFAYGWVSVECATLPNLFSFAHEVGHIMGSEHQRDESCWLGSGACVSNPPDIASFDFSYAAFDSFGADRFQTLMGAFPALVAPPQFVQFSNEEVLINGQASGVAGEAENAETVSTLAPIVEGFREETPIFSDGFESI